jgi:hypothetical protein
VPAAAAACMSDDDNWEVLLWAAIACARQWHRMTRPGGGAHDAASRSVSVCMCVGCAVVCHFARSMGSGLK